MAKIRPFFKIEEIEAKPFQSKKVEFPFSLVCKHYHGMFLALAFMLQHSIHTRREKRTLVNIHTTQK
jgi:hypothetical protein